MAHIPNAIVVTIIYFITIIKQWKMNYYLPLMPIQSILVILLKDIDPSKYKNSYFGALWTGWIMILTYCIINVMIQNIVKTKSKTFSEVCYTILYCFFMLGTFITTHFVKTNKWMNIEY